MSPAYSVSQFLASAASEKLAVVLTQLAEIWASST
jgi:hypothetical protein